MSIYINHNKTLLLCHLVFPVKYRKKVFDKKIDKKLQEICIEISQRYEIHFVEIGNDFDYINLLAQSVPTMTITSIVTVIKSITAKRILRHFQPT